MYVHKSFITSTQVRVIWFLIAFVGFVSFSCGYFQSLKLCMNVLCISRHFLPRRDGAGSTKWGLSEFPCRLF